MSESTPTYACTHDLDGARARLPQLRALSELLTGRERDDGRVVLRFADRGEGRALVEEFVADEQRCCDFFGFDVRDDGGEVRLEITAPRGAQEMLDGLAEAFEPGRSDDALLAPFRSAADDHVGRPPEVRQHP